MDVGEKRSVRALGWLLGGLVLAGVAPASGTSVPAKPPAYADAPDAVRTFLVAAKRAEALKDPLERCLAYPDLPGNAWPKGMAQAFCHYTHDPAVTLDMVRDALDHHRLAALEARFKADLERHFVKQPFSEIIHSDFVAFDASQEAGRLSQRLLDQAPHSAFALTARGTYFRRMAWKARGGAWAKDTPAENMQRMSEFSAKAIDLFQQAIAIEPRMMPAYASIEDLARLQSQASLAKRTFAAGMAIDPACSWLAEHWMDGLKPRWGGSYPQMLVYAEQLKAFLPERPLLAVAIEAPVLDLADVASTNDSYDEGIKLLRQAMVHSADSLIPTEIALWSDQAGTGDRWEQLMLLLEAGRFLPGSQEAAHLRGRLLLLVAKEPVWARSSLKRAVELEPDNADAHYLLAASYWNAGDPAGSEHDYVLAMDDATVRRDALYELTEAMLQARQVAKARRYIDRLNKEYPNDGPGWHLRAGVLIAGGADTGEVTAAMRQFVAHADRSDLTQLLQVRQIEGELRKIDAFTAHAKPQP